MTGHERHAADGEAGLTLIELAVTMMLLGIVLGMVVQVMVSVQSSVELQAGRSARNDRLGLAVRALERQIRSGEVLGDPATEADAANDIAAGMSIRIRTRSTGTIEAERCVQWRIDGTGRLESRAWSPNWLVDGDYTGWQLAVDGVANRAAAPAVDAFTRSAAPEYAGRVVEIRLLARGDGPADAVQRVETSVTGRGAAVGAPAAASCDDLPPYT